MHEQVHTEHAAQELPDWAPGQRKPPGAASLHLPPSPQVHSLVDPEEQQQRKQQSGDAGERHAGLSLPQYPAGSEREGTAQEAGAAGDAGDVDSWRGSRSDAPGVDESVKRGGGSGSAHADASAERHTAVVLPGMAQSSSGHGEGGSREAAEGSSSSGQSVQAAAGGNEGSRHGGGALALATAVALLAAALTALGFLMLRQYRLRHQVRAQHIIKHSSAGHVMAFLKPHLPSHSTPAGLARGLHCLIWQPCLMLCILCAGAAVPRLGGRRGHRAGRGRDAGRGLPAAQGRSLLLRRGRRGRAGPKQRRERQETGACDQPHGARRVQPGA